MANTPSNKPTDRPLTDAPATGPGVPDATPDPHRGEPLPAPQDGTRPEALASGLARPEQEEENPLTGLLHAAATQAKGEVGAVGATAGASPGPAASGVDAEAARIGVESEGVESSQLLGLMLAVGFTLVAVLVTVYYLFIVTSKQASEANADAIPASRYVELRDTEIAAADLVGNYAAEGDSVFRIPVDAAMDRVAAEYGARTGAGSNAYQQRPHFNTAMIQLGPAAAVASQTDRGPLTAPLPQDSSATPAASGPGAPANVAPPAPATPAPPTTTPDAPAAVEPVPPVN